MAAVAGCARDGATNDLTTLPVRTQPLGLTLIGRGKQRLVNVGSNPTLSANTCLFLSVLGVLRSLGAFEIKPLHELICKRVDIRKRE